MIRSISLFFISLPFLFGLLRASTTGTDFRYLWLAAASFVGAGAITIAGQSRIRQLRVAAAVAAASFLVGTAGATAAGMLLGTHFGIGLLVVASGFAFCCAIGFLLFAITLR